MKLVCPAGSLPALFEAVDNGADAVYLGFRDTTNARAFPGLNFSPKDLARGLKHARSAGCEIYLALNTYPTCRKLGQAFDAVDRASDLDADALIIAEISVLEYAANKLPGSAPAPFRSRIGDHHRVTGLLPAAIRHFPCGAAARSGPAAGRAPGGQRAGGRR